MFVGTTPQEVKLLLQDLMKESSYKDVFIGCSGNFSVDKVMSKLGYSVHSNDVSLYSKLIADIVMGTDTELKVTNDELKPVFEGWPDSKFKKLIQVMYAMKISKFAPRKNDYQKSFFDVYINESVNYYENTIEKMEKGAFDFNIKSFAFCDFIEFLKNKRGTGVGISFPPTYKSGYEKIFDYVEKSFDYQRAVYPLFDPKTEEPLFRELLEEDENIFYSDRDWDSLETYKVGVVNLGQGKHPVYIYSSINKEDNYYFERETKPLNCNISVLPTDYKFTKDSRITVEICNVKDINYFKAFYMANKVNYTTGGDFGLIFFADGKAFGFASFSKTLSTIELMFIQSDFVVNSETPRLSKLLIMLLKSREVRHWIARKTANYYEGLKTTVYTDKPVSMKYRGVFELDRRDKGKLIYVAKFSEQSLGEIYWQWFSKNVENDKMIVTMN